MACTSDTANKETIQDGEFTFLALGDSYTIGQSVDAELRWPVQLADTLNKDGIAIGEPLIVARTGWTTDELVQGIADKGITGTYDLVSLLIGVNNQYRGRDSEEFREEFSSLLDRAINFAGSNTKRVFVLSIPDWGVMPFAEGRDRQTIAQEIDLYNSICREECEKSGIAFYDITPISREAAEKTELIADDGLHPSGAMYREWVELIYPDIKTILLK